MRYITFIAAFIFANLISAQVAKTTFTGEVIDEDNQPIPGATLMILNRNDSTLVQFGGTDNAGKFTIKNVPAGEYYLNANFLGMQPVFLPVEAGLTTDVALDQIMMSPAAKVLGAVEVKADFVPIEITKDTITYNPDAFETQPNAMVEDLLKKLPGIEVAADGSIKAQGEDVQKVLVDGKEFFGDDPKMATKNLPANALKKVKVYDRSSDMAQFTGVDDGTREKTIDLQLKEEFKKGLFGSVQAGYGSDDRYNGKASVNKFSKTYQLSFLGQLNNINDQGFSFTDRMNFSGGMRGMGGGRSGGQTIEIRSTGNGSDPFGGGGNTGLIQTGAAGLNFNYQKNKNFNIRSSYFFNSVDKELLQTSFRQNISSTPFDAEKDTEENSTNQSHNFSLNSDWQVDSTSQIQLSSRLGIASGDGTNESDLRNFANQLLQSQSVTSNHNVVDNLTLSGNLTYMKRLGTRGRNFSVSGSVNKNNNDNENFLDAYNEYFSTGNAELLNQAQNSASGDIRYEGQFSYTEPLRKRRFLEFTYAYSQMESDYDRRVTDITDTSAMVNPSLSNNYNSIFSYHRPGATFRYSGEIHNVSLALQYQTSELEGFIQNNESQIRQTYAHLLPRVIWRYDIGNGKHLRMSYTTRVNAPSITQLTPVVDNSDPLRLYVGNPELDAEYNHSININFHSFSQFSSTSFFASVRSSLTQDKIISSRSVDAQLIEISRPINIDNESQLSFYGSFGRPFKPLHSRFTINADMSFTNTQNEINQQLLDVNRWSRTAGLTISNLNSKVLEYNLGTRFTFTDNYYQSEATPDQTTLRSNYFVDATLTLWKKWRIQGEYDYSLYSSSEFAENQSLPLLEFSISRYLLKDDRGQLKFSIFDALDENRGIVRTADINYLEEVRSNSIGRYAMLSFIYTIRGSGMAMSPGAMRFIERRG